MKTKTHAIDTAHTQALSNSIPTLCYIGNFSWRCGACTHRLWTANKLPYTILNEMALGRRR